MGEKLSRETSIVKCSYWLMCFGMCLVFFIPCLKIQPGPDTYMSLYGFEGYFSHALSNGRPVHALVYCFFYYVSRYSVEVAIFLSNLVAILTISVAVYRLGDVIRRDIASIYHDDGKTIVIFANILSFVIICNLFCIEYFLFPEVGVMWILPIWLCVEASILYRQFMVLSEYKYIFYSFIFLIISAFSYQIVVSLFVILIEPYVLTYSKNIKELFKHNLFIGLLYSIPLGINYLFSKLMVDNKRLNGIGEGIVNNLNSYVPAGLSPQQYIADRITFGMVVYCIICLGIACLLIVKVIEDMEYIQLIKGLLLAAIIVILGMLPFITGASDNITPRLYYPLGTLFGVLIWYGLLNRFISIRGQDKASIALCFLLAMCFVGQISSFSDIYTERIMTNYNDRALSEIYGEYIKKIELSNNQHVEKVRFYKDKYKTKYISYKGWCISERVYGVGWGELEALNYWLGADYVNGEYDQEVAEFFASKDWDTFDEEQVIYKNGVVHICNY